MNKLLFETRMSGYQGQFTVKTERLLDGISLPRYQRFEMQGSCLCGICS